MTTDYRGESVYRDDLEAYAFGGPCFGCGRSCCVCDDDADDYGCWYCKSADCECVS